MTIATLTAERRRIEADLEGRLAADPKQLRQRVILQSLPGFGPSVSTTLMTDMPELGTLDRRGAASLAGVAPHPSQSGTGPARNEIAGG